MALTNHHERLPTTTCETCGFPAEYVIDNADGHPEAVCDVHYFEPTEGTVRRLVVA